MKYISKTEQETFEIGLKLADKIQKGNVFLLEGSLGAGKSVLIRGIAAGLGVEEAIPSPTFTLVNEYLTPNWQIFHFDFYRLNDPYELYEIGFEEYIYSEGITFIEWPSKGGDLIPENSIKINIQILAEGEREINIQWPT
ncbi:MAG: tRNA (adenosine(37)-N6)-threonylcarbamoyltransferase complex ATPase subunit type 1 TsaE [Spirochaetes bacterium]|nr:tRNA (adenosine(37)-N6)-threonylcarbamoyltransferase complex ATPase subunit type 1 TsaE [Spirochaetota bacterium]